MRRALLAGVSVVLVVFLSSAVWAQEAPKMELGLLLGAAFPSRDLTGLPQTSDRDSLLVGWRAAMEIGPSVQLFGDFAWHHYNEGLAKSQDTNEYAVRIGPEFYFGRRIQLFVAPAVGWSIFNPTHGDTYGRPIASVGLGQRFLFKGSDSFRWEIRGERAFSGGGDGPEDFTNVAVLLGYSFGWSSTDR